MARHSFGGAPPHQNTIFSVQDHEGNVILDVRKEEYIVVEPDGSLSSYTRDQSILLVCGTVWGPSMLREKPPVYLGLCESCRNPGISLLRGQRRSHGLVAMYRARLCTDCGILCCPRHRRIGKEGKWRCLSCDRKHRVINLLKPVFFRREG